jgi:hypothetical protein
MNDNHAQHEHVVHEAIGADVSAVEAAAAIGLSVVSLMLAGVLPALLGALADEGRISQDGIGLCAALEALTMGIVTGLATIALPPKRLKLIGVIASVALAGLDFSMCLGAAHMTIFVIRALAGIPEGILLWLAVSMIVRSQVPERWAGVLFTATTASQLVLALAYAFFIVPKFGANGGFLALSIVTLPGIAIALFAPDRYAPLPGSEGGAGFPPLKGAVALAATLIYASAAAAVGIYLQPLAHQAGLSADVARTALWVSLIAQIAGAGAATALAGHLRYLTAFLIVTPLLIGSWVLFVIHPPAWLFVFANAAAGGLSLFILPFFVPMTIEADTSRSAASQSAGAQLLASALGPLMASMAVSGRDAYGVLLLGDALLIAGLVIIGGLHVITLRERRHAV